MSQRNAERSDPPLRVAGRPCHPQTGRAADDRPDHLYPKKLAACRDAGCSAEQRFAPAR